MLQTMASKLLAAISARMKDILRADGRGGVPNQPRNSGLRSATAQVRLSPRVRRVFSLTLSLNLFRLFWRT